MSDSPGRATGEDNQTLMDDPTIRLETDSNVAVIRLNRPQVLNCFNRSMASTMVATLQQIGEDDDVRAVLLTGEGRAFCAGQDLGEAMTLAENSLTVSDLVREGYNRVVLGLRRLPKPVVAAVNGVAAGAGANLALACDFVLASEDAVFVQSFSRIGLIPDTGGTYFLPRLVGLARATEFMMLGDKLNARRAFEAGLIYRVCPPSALLPEALETAQRLARLPTRALGLIKQALEQSLQLDLPAQLEVEAELQGEASRTRDFAEGIAAFLEKRKPRFEGR